MKKIKIGARGSNLSQIYANKVKNLIRINNKNFKDVEIEIVSIKTSGDIIKDQKLSGVGGKRLFCKEIEESLISQDIDIAVHSLKDMEANEIEELTIGAFLKRNDHRDVLVSNTIKNFSDLSLKKIIGSSSRRRQLQLKKNFKNLLFQNVRGNIDSRIENFEKKKLDGLILAAAGIKCLNLENKISLTFDISQIIPAPGQGIIAAQCRKKDNLIKKILTGINDKETCFCALAERSMLKTVGGDCETAIGGFAEVKDKILFLKAELFSDDGNECFKYEMKGKDTEAEEIGKKVGSKLLELAGEKFKKQ